MENKTNISAEYDVGSDNQQLVIYYGVNGFGISWTYLVIHIALASVAFVGIALNSFTLWALRGKDSGLDVSIIFISNLAASDIINDVMCIYLVFYNLIHYKNYYECAFRTGVITGINFNSALQLLALTLERYFKIIHPFKYVSVFKDKTAKLFCACAWILSTILSLLPLFGLRQPPSHGIEYCSFFGVQTDEYLILMTACFYLVMLISVLCYYKILAASFAQSKKCLNKQATKHLWWKPTKTVLILFLFYFACWIPLSACVILHLSDGFPANYTNDMKGTVLAYCSSLVFLDTIVNPLIYALKIQTVKYKLKQLMFWCKPPSKTGDISTFKMDRFDSCTSDIHVCA